MFKINQLFNRCLSASLALLTSASLMAQGAPTVGEEDIVVKWDFASDVMGLEKGNFQNETQTCTVDGVAMTLIAGKVRDNGGSYQLNDGTILQIPVNSTNDRVTIVPYPKYGYYTINGTVVEQSNETLTYKITSQNVTDGYVQIVSNNNNCYLASVTMTYGSAYQEKCLYSSDFSEWASCDMKTTTNKVVNLKTSYSRENFTATLNGVGAYPTGEKTSGDNTYTGFLESAKVTECNFEASMLVEGLSSVTKLVFQQFATGGTRGWNVKVKGDGDEDWVVVFGDPISDKSGQEVSIDINRKNCSICFYAYNTAQNCYMDWIKIYGKVDLSNSPMLDNFTFAGTTYAAADLFTEAADGSMEGTVEVSKTTSMPTTSDLSFTAANGTLGEATFSSVENEQVDVTIPVTLTVGEETLVTNYTIHFVWKPDFTLTYFDADGKTQVGTQIVEKDATIGEFSYNDANVTVPSGSKFRGWLVSTVTGQKATTADVITADITLTALVTDIEGDEPNERNVFNLKKKYFYPEDHEAFNPTSAYSYNSSQHGLNVKAGSIDILVNGNATIIAEMCKYDGAAAILIKKGDETLATLEKVATDGTKNIYNYEGEACTLSLVFEDGEIYLHSLTIINTGTGTFAKNDAGYYVCEPGSISSFLNAVDMADAQRSSTNERAYIFLPNGTYDFGDEVENTLPSNISIIGQSTEGTIILTSPDKSIEGLGSADLFYFGANVQNVYFQDLTLQNGLDYYGASDGRAAVLQDRGNRTIGKNVRMLSYQDTYYSQNSSMQSYWENCDIHGTVDFICGGGDVRFQDCTISLEPRKLDGSGSRTVTAPTSSTNFGYVFDGCQVIDLANGKGEWNLGRTWQNKPICVWLNTTMDDNAIKTIIASRWIEKGMNNTDPNVFGEFNTMNVKGENMLPASNIINSYKGSFETILTQEQADAYAYNLMFTNWDPKALCQQVEMGDITVDGAQVSWTAAEGAIAYAIFVNDIYDGMTTSTSYTLSAAPAADATVTVRAANSMGGFSSPAYMPELPTAIAQLDADVQVVGVEYYTLGGQKLKTAQRGINICVLKLSNGQTIANKLLVK